MAGDAGRTADGFGEIERADDVLASRTANEVSDFTPAPVKDDDEDDDDDDENGTAGEAERELTSGLFAARGGALVPLPLPVPCALPTRAAVLSGSAAAAVR
jgi:hypothetical protein